MISKEYKLSNKMKHKKTCLKSNDYFCPNSILDSNISESIGTGSNISLQLVNHYKNKSQKLEKEFNNLLDIIDQIKSTCDLSNDLQRELSVRNEEVSKLQKVISDLQVHLFREKEQTLKLSGENDKLRIEDYENKKRIQSLLMGNGGCERNFFQFKTKGPMNKIVETKLPPKLQKLKEAKQREILKQITQDRKEVEEYESHDIETLLFNNKSLSSQLEQHRNISKQQIEMLIEEKEIAEDERKIERQRLQKDIDLLTINLKKSQDLLCETTGKLLKSQQTFEKEKTAWIEEKNKYLQIIEVIKEKQGQDVPDVPGYYVNGVGLKARICGENEITKERIIEKEQMTAIQKEQVLALEAEVNRLKERALACRRTFKEKTEKMSEQVVYLKNKYKDLDRRRLLEAEGFRTDIKMLRERLKELEKKLAKTSVSFQPNEQQLLVSARNTLNRARQLEKELTQMKSKISALEFTEDQFLS